jgi:hypothetical protein
MVDSIEQERLTEEFELRESYSEIYAAELENKNREHCNGDGAEQVDVGEIDDEQQIDKDSIENVDSGVVDTTIELEEPAQVLAVPDNAVTSDSENLQTIVEHNEPADDTSNVRFISENRYML